MPLQFTTTGSDALGNFTVLIPGICASCSQPTDVVLKYAVMRLGTNLRARGIDPQSPSLVLKRKREIGVTCGCYARWQRQVAHISDRKKAAESSERSS